MKHFIPLAIILMTNGANASDYLSDGFGLVPAKSVSQQRAAWSGLITGPDGATERAPENAENVLIFVGPKSLVAGADDGHAVSLNFDRHGNLVADGLSVDFRVGSTQMTDPATLNGIGDVLFRPEPTAGSFVAGATLQNRQSLRATYRVTADMNSLILQNRPVERELTFETFVSLSTETLTDKYGNIADDGIGAAMTITHSDGAYTLLSSVVSDGRANSKLLTRDIPKDGRLSTTLGPTQSKEMHLSVKPVGELAPARVTLKAVPKINAVALQAGPFLTSEGHLLNDGAGVSVTIQAASGASATSHGWLLDGQFETVLTLDPQDGPFDVQITTPLGINDTRLVLQPAAIGISQQGAE